MRTLSLLVFASFSLLLTSCITPSGTPHAGSGNTGTGKVTTGNTVTESQTPIILEHASLSGTLLTSEAADTLRAKYASGVSRTYIPYMIFGSGSFSIPGIQLLFIPDGFPFVADTNEKYERESDDEFFYRQNQKHKQLNYYNTLFGKTHDSQNGTEFYTGKYLCLGIQGIVAKTDGKFSLYTEASAIGNIPVSETPFSELFPLSGRAYIGIGGKATKKIYTDSGNISPYNYISIFPTEYREIGGENYFVFPITRDDEGIPYQFSVNGKAESEVEGVFSPTLKDCTIERGKFPQSLKILMMPPDGYMYDGQQSIDYRGLVQTYFIQFSNFMGVPRHILMTTNTGAVFDLSMLHYNARDLPHDGEGIIRPSNVNTIQCIGSNCTLVIRSGALSHIHSLELFYDEK